MSTEWYTRETLATPESRRVAVLEAAQEAVGICVEYDHDSVQRAEKLAEAEDRFHERLGKDAVASAFAYRDAYAVILRARTAPFVGSEYGCEVGYGGTMWVRAHVGGTHEFRTIAHFQRCDTFQTSSYVERARIPCATIGPRMYYKYAGLSTPHRSITGRESAVEMRMWHNWWTACADVITSDWDSLVGTRGKMNPLLDARFCKGALTLTHYLLSVGAKRMDDAVLASDRFHEEWKRRENPSDDDIQSYYWLWAERSLPIYDHTSRHWASLSTQSLHHLNYIDNMAAWTHTRALLIGFSNLMERVCNTPALRHALEMPQLENDLISLVVPSAVYQGGSNRDSSVAESEAT